MKRGLALGVLIVVGALSVGIRAVLQAQAAADAPKVIEVDKLKDNLFVLKGGGGNTAVFVTANGVVVVDAKNPGWGQPILDKIKTLTTKPITTLINTHTHGDHVSGNVEFPATIDIVVQENTKVNMQKMTGPSGLPAVTSNIFTEHGGRGMPKRTFKDTMTIGGGNDRVDLYYFGRGHTNGDAWVVFPSLRVAHAGDIFSGKNLPLLDANNGGSGVLIGDTLEKAYTTLSSVDTIITGHSTQMTPADLKEYAAFNREFLNDMREAKKTGKTVDQVAATWTLPAKYAGYAAAQPARLKSNAQVIFDELK